MPVATEITQGLQGIAMKKTVINLIEPTLQNYTGHCHGYVSSLLKVLLKNNNHSIAFTTWIGRKAKTIYFPPHGNLRYYFNYRLRKIQQLFLYNRLISNNENIFIPTASSFDLNLLTLILRRTKHCHYHGRIFLYFHQFRRAKRKKKLLDKFINHAPTGIILTSTDRLTALFKAMGAKNAYTLPCPVYHPTSSNQQKRTSTVLKLLYTGAARHDKGFPAIVDFIDYLSKSSEKMPVHIQAPKPHNNRYDKHTATALEKLVNLNYKPLSIGYQSLNQTEYLHLFKNSICLLLYDPQEYSDKFSGVALEAVYCASPIITTPGTWISELVNTYQAGITINEKSPEAILSAVKLIYKEYDHYQLNARKAGQLLKPQHTPEHTIQLLATMLKAPLT